MQPEDIVLIPPTHEVSTPSFHVKKPSCDAFEAYLDAHEIRMTEPPTPIGPDGDELMEFRVEAGTPMTTLESLLADFHEANPR